MRFLNYIDDITHICAQNFVENNGKHLWNIISRHLNITNLLQKFTETELLAVYISVIGRVPATALNALMLMLIINNEVVPFLI